MMLRVIGVISTLENGFTYERVRFTADDEESLVRKLGEGVLGLLKETNASPALQVKIERA